MHKNLIYTLIIIISIQLYSCDCSQRAKGVILDKRTNKPIDSVYIHKIGEQYGEYSDSSGHFEIHSISGGFFGCPILKIGIVKNGYKVSTEESTNGDSAIIYLERDN